MKVSRLKLVLVFVTLVALSLALAHCGKSSSDSGYPGTAASVKI